MAAEKQTVGLKLDPELAAKFKELQGQAGSAQDFVETLLAAYAQAQEETDTASPIYKEQVKVKQALASVERVVSAYLELAAHDKAQAQAMADEQIIVAQEEVTTLKDRLTIKTHEVADLQTRNTDLEKQVESLESQIESLDMLKASWAVQESAWAEKESGYVSRIGELDTEAKDARALKGRMTDLEKTLAEQRQAIALAEQKAGTDQAAITDLKAQITSLKDDHKTEISSLKIEHRQAMDEFKQAQANEKQDLIDTHRHALADRDQQRKDLEISIKELETSLKTTEKALSVAALDCSEQISEMKTQAAKQQGKLEQQITTLKDQLNKTDRP